MLPIIKVIPKMWGYEHIIINTDLYAAKYLIINPQFGSSLHYHKNKTETFIVVQGNPQITIDNDVKLYSNGDTIDIQPGVLHKFANLTELPAIIFEISTYDDPSDSYRKDKSGPIKGK